LINGNVTVYWVNVDRMESVEKRSRGTGDGRWSREDGEKRGMDAYL
jgi:hypothetical protein